MKFARKRPILRLISRFKSKKKVSVSARVTERYHRKKMWLSFLGRKTVNL